MKNKLQYLSLLIFCVAVIVGATGGVAAQSANSGDKILVAGRTPLKQWHVSRLIEFYEWAFETRFTPDERERYQTFTVADFRRDADTSRRQAEDLISALAEIRTRDTAAQAAARRAFLEGFAKDLRASTEEDARFLLGIYERGQNGDDAGAGSRSGDSRGAENASSNRGGAGSSKLVGAWFRSDGTGGSRDATGKTLYNSGTDTTFEFFADGTMRAIIKKEALSITQCQILETTNISGTYRASGNELTMNFDGGTIVGKDSCKSSGNFKKNLSASSLTKTFVVKNLDSIFRPDAPLILCLDGAKDDDCFERTVK